MMIKSQNKRYFSIALISIGAIIIIKGIFDLGFHYGIEELRKSDSGLGGFGEWGGAIIETLIGLLLASVGTELTKNKKGNKINP